MDVMAWYLPNGKKIDEDGLVEAFGNVTSAQRHVLDVETGNIGCTQTDPGASTKMLDHARYIDIPHVEAKEQMKWLREMMAATMEPEDKALIDGLKQVMSQEGTGHAELLVACEQKLEDDKSGWEHGWLPWKGDHLWERAGEWLKTLPIPIEDKFEIDCDCELCKLFEMDGHTLGDYFEAAQKQERKDKKKKRTEQGHE